MVKSLVSKLSSASSNLSIASTISSVVSHSGATDSSSIKNRNDPGRFFGDGVQFKAKLIGILEVGEARGDRMCQEALQDLKMAIRAAGEHKQRITIHVTIDGLRLRDEKTGDSLYHHPVHKISFIAQDMTDSRAFGYIFGSPDSGHRFFGIKTDKAASQVVLAMRDLFQVVFELKKKEIELARQQIQSKSIHDHQSLSSLASLKATTGGHNDLSGGAGPSSLSMLSSLNASATGSSLKMGYNIGDAKNNFNNVKEMSPESVADLVDLEQELSSIQRGITQMERITPSDSTPTLGCSSNKTGGNDEDPFGDSFTNFPTYNLLPPPESSRSRSKPNKSSDSNATATTTTTSTNSKTNSNISTTVTSLISTAPIASNSPLNIQQEDDDSWLKELDKKNDVFDTSKTGLMGLGVGMSAAPLAPSESTSTPTSQLGAGTNFDLPISSSVGMAGATAASVTLTTTFNSEALTVSSVEQAQMSSLANAVKSESCPTGAGTGGGGDSTTGGTGGDLVMLPRDTDPFSPTRKKSDPFQEGDIFANLDPFEFEFSASNESAPTTTSQQQLKQQRSTPVLDSVGGSTTTRKITTDVFNGPLQVSLPPESGGAVQATAQQWKPLNETVGNNVARSRPSAVLAPGQLQSNASSAFKQQTADVISSISNKKMPHLFGQARFSKRDSNSINMRRLQESDSLSENESAPEPPPRPDSASHAEPPPLPPKKQFSDIVIRPRGIAAVSSATMSSAPTTAAASLATSANRYEFLNSGLKLSSNTRASSGNADVPPIPLPSRRVGRSDGMYPGPGRPRKPGHTEDDYLAPISSASAVSATASSGSSSLPPTDVPPLLPPPTQTSTRARTQRQLSLQQQGKSQEIYENKSEIIREQQQRAEEAADLVPAILPDITLSQLLTLGIDELATKLNVPTSKLSTMTLVELTSYLSEFLEKSKPPQQQQMQSIHSQKKREAEEGGTKQSEMDEPVIFKVNFNQEATFVAKFDDNFGEMQHDAFVADFEQFNEPAPQHSSRKSSTSRTPAVPPADRYAVFREIIDQEMQQRQEDTDLLGDMLTDENIDTEAASSAKASAIELSQIQDSNSSFAAHFSDHDDLLSRPLRQKAPTRIDTKITEVVAQAKDRYAALRDIILVENLFDKQPPSIGEQQFEQHHVDLMSVDADFPDFGDEDQDLKQIMENDRASSRGFAAEASSSALTVGDDDDEEEDGIAESSLDSNEKDGGLGSGGSKELAQDQYEKLSTSTQQLDIKDEKSERSNNLITAKQDNNFLTVAGSSGLSSSKDDLEIDDLMQRAISNLSLDSRERSSPATAPVTVTLTSDSTTRPRDNSPGFATTKSQFNDVSTSPIPIQKSPATVQQVQQQKSQLQRKSPETSSIPAQLTAVSHLIDTASRQISVDQGSSVHSKESWATFDSPKTQSYLSSGGGEKHRTHKRDRRSKSPKAITLHIPPPPPSNASQNDTAESPCSSDPRDERWSKNVRRWPKTDRSAGGGGGGSNAPQTSSSSRDLSPWDDEVPDNYPKQRRGPTLQAVVGPVDHPHGHADRHGYYMRHARRMNSCDEDYDYDDVFSKRRDHRKFKQGISRSRDHFEFESPSWYHHPQHHTWSPQDEESSVGTSSRARSFDRSTYERTTYGPPIYDKRGVALPPVVTHDRRSAGGGGGYDKRKYYRDYSRPMYDFDGYGEPPPPPPSQERRARRDYENIYDVDSRSPMGVGYSSKSRASEYMYERDRKSFDRESVESFDSATRRRRSFGSGDVYGSLESREEFRERYIGVGSLDPKETTRSLRKGGLKSRNAPAEIDYEQDSDINDFQQHQRGGIIRGAPLESRSLQRPNQLGSVGSIGGVGIQQRVRKSSGSSPWDGDEPMPHMGAGSSIPAIPPTGQKSWKRPSSAADSERRLVESRRAPAVPQALSGSDGEKDRRFRKKQRLRGKEPTSAATNARYGGSGGHSRENYDYMTYANDNDDEEDIDDDDYVDEEEYDDPPTDEDKFERLNRRRQEMHQRMLESEHRRQQQHSMNKGPPPLPITSALKGKGNKYHGSTRSTEFVDFDDFEASTPISRSGADSGVGGSDTVKSSNMTVATTADTSTTSATTKFIFDDAGGFESDFNQSSPPPAPAGTASSCNSTPAATLSAASITTPATKSSFRFSNDFSEREKHQQQQQHHFSAQNSTSISSLQQFDLDNVTTIHATPPITQKLRFDDNVKISKFDNDSHIPTNSDAFEDDFAKAEFDFEKEDQWSADALQTAATTAKKNRSSKLQQRQELIKKSESINIFGKKTEDPFEDDDFFNAPTSTGGTGNGSDGTKKEAKNKLSADNGSSGGFQWEDDEHNFAKFDENM